MKATTRQVLYPLLQSDDTITPRQIEQVMRVLSAESLGTENAVKIEPFTTLREVAKALNVSTVSLWRWQIPGHELGGQRRFRLSEVVAYLESEQFKRWVKELREDRKTTYQSKKRSQPCSVYSEAASKPCH